MISTRFSLPRAFLIASFGFFDSCLALGITSVFPENHATAACTDTPLKITFDAPPVAGASGMVRIRRSDGYVADTIPRLVNIRDEVYQEVVRVNSKHHLTFRGESRKHTIVSYPNNNSLNPGANTRAMFSVVANDTSFENLTLSNSTPKGGSQAEALRVNGQRCLVGQCDLHSFQNTFLISSEPDTACVVDSFIEGDVDFIWGFGRVVFRRCKIKSLISGYICQTRNPAGHCGAVFLDCKLTRASGVSKVFLARIDPGVFPHSAVAFVNCAMDTHIVPAGWLLNHADHAPNVRFDEYQSTDLCQREGSVFQPNLHCRSR